MELKNYSKKQLIGFYETMYRMRRFEEEVFEFYKQGMMPGLAHLYLGEEAIATGVCAALKDSDYIGSTHRGHGHLVARGAQIDKMMAEILGKEGGYSKGKGGSMHIMALDKGILGANGIVGGEIPIATGAAYTARYLGTDQVAVSFFGESATNEGTFHESINMAAAWKLPIVYVIENNLYGISVDIRDVTNTENLADRAAAYGISGVVVDGMNVIAVHQAAEKAVKRARDGEGPTLIECKTYRWQGHHVGDPAVYRARRNEKEKAEWMERCPVNALRAALINGKVTEKEMLKIEETIEAEVQAAVTFAKESPYPDPSEAYTDIFA
ncbi:thiamine pyrophosphate-dependent dehydrogenase E1 component subunit alpha [Sinanaerobacter chloroacetimidivorans]|uniref:Thiamine pyrophosphate-dependent dehydrogenase E1 component subunit alpha n=1 Tax=Sinanaerobacter chloroacetimidivorans TaxID=2818044 RepID=A0A8J7W5B5_9FIRM|nr:thiamine pyrophosphate-dependent dehydrogenase E1 component subunit alpha [Sinanaerobacter chloroacetimidivorans]MBR0599225.1 thiamine pyrophosphate-dependent dehydrogenase E1 component subunit alpha [Sinanaerobacter chloroacetimidivorans]